MRLKNCLITPGISAGVTRAALNQASRCSLPMASGQERTMNFEERDKYGMYKGRTDFTAEGDRGPGRG